MNLDDFRDAIDYFAKRDGDNSLILLFIASRVIKSEESNVQVHRPDTGSHNQSQSD